MSTKLDVQALASPSCPAPAEEGERVVLAHGACAGATTRLLERHIFPHIDNALLAPRHDGAVLEPGAAGGRLAFTTDGFVVQPLFFPGGDIGKLAVHGTLNDLAMCGAQPLALACGWVLEEGLPIATVERVARSLGDAARAAGVRIATGDTKVVERGKGDGVFLHTTGVGTLASDRQLAPERVAPGDAILVSGPIGAHGAAVLSVREGLAFESEIVSDQAWLGPLVEALLCAVEEVSCLRDPTRGGLGAVLHELATAAGAEVELESDAVPVAPPVRAACELLGLDPLFLACEGRLVAFVREAHAEAALAALRGHGDGREAARIGTVRAGRARVVVETGLGTRRLLPLPVGEPLPRIC